MKFSTLKGRTDSPEVNSDYESAAQFGKVRVGNLGVYYPGALRTQFMAYEDFDRAFIRIHEVNGKLCCGSTVFQYFRLVFVKDGKEISDYVCEDEKAMDGVLADIAGKAPSINIGFETKE